MPAGAPPKTAPSADVRVWAWGDLHLRVEPRAIGSAEGEKRAEGGRDAATRERLVLEGSGGVSFRSAAIVSRSGRATEVARPIAPRPSRLDKVDVGTPAGVALEQDRTPLQASVLTIAPEGSRRAQPGAQLADLLLTATGTDAAGNVFRRMIPVNTLALEPRSAWRERVDPPAPKLVAVTGARVVAVDYDAQSGEIGALVLGKGDKRRTVRVTSAGLREGLARVDLSAPNLLFQVRDDALCAVVAVLGEMGSLDAEPGIEGPIPEPPVVQKESAGTDYPGASRFVAAKFFQTSNASRSIQRVVVHITDGSPRIDGTISWFQDPKAANGTYSKVSAHYVVGQDGEVVQMVRDNDVAYHAGSANADSIGIEHVARSPGAFGATDAGLSPTPAEYAASAALVRWICEEYGIPQDRNHILGHAQADPGTTHAGCPDAVWDWAYFMNLIAAGTSADPEDL
ncbi:MAG: peptidoglycan recognition family protein [Minicystis sp.]